MDIFKIFLQIIFDWEQREENNNSTKNSSRSAILTLITLLRVDELVRGSVVNQSWSTQFLVATFSQMALFGSWTTCYDSATCKKVSVATSLFSIFIHQITKNTTGLNIYSIYYL